MFYLLQLAISAALYALWPLLIVIIVCKIAGDKMKISIRERNAAFAVERSKEKRRAISKEIHKQSIILRVMKVVTIICWVVIIGFIVCFIVWVLYFFIGLMHAFSFINMTR